MGDLIPGIDVSHHNGPIDWANVRRLNPALRVVYVKASEGGTFKDPAFLRNVRSAHANGFEVGAYHFVLPTVPAGIQISNFVSRVGLVGDLLTRKPVLDAEQVGAPDAWLSIGIEERIQKLLKMRDAVLRATGMQPKLYASPAFIRDVLRSDSRLRVFGLWLAAYRDVSQPPTAPAPFADWDGWQHSQHGYVAGLAGEVDLNLWRNPKAK